MGLLIAELPFQLTGIAFLLDYMETLGTQLYYQNVEIHSQCNKFYLHVDTPSNMMLITDLTNAM